MRLHCIRPLRIQLSRHRHMQNFACCFLQRAFLLASKATVISQRWLYMLALQLYATRFSQYFAKKYKKNKKTTYFLKKVQKNYGFFF